MTTDSLSLDRAAPVAPARPDLTFGQVFPATCARDLSTLPSVDDLLSCDPSTALDDGVMGYARDGDKFAVVHGCGGVEWRGATAEGAELAMFGAALRACDCADGFLDLGDAIDALLGGDKQSAAWGTC